LFFDRYSVLERFNMNNDTPLQSTYAPSQLDTNIQVAVDEIVKYIGQIDDGYKKTMGEDFIYLRIYEMIKTNIEGNVNWNRGG